MTTDEVALAEPESYSMRLSRLTIDKLGVKLYDRASAVVAELIANGYDADAEHVTVTLPLGKQLAGKGDGGKPEDLGFVVSVSDDGHGMTPGEVQKYFLFVGTDRRHRATGGTHSREKARPVMGRKGIGKLAPFGICTTIEVRSAGGPKTDQGYRVSHLILEFDKLVQDVESDVPVESGLDDKTWDAERGTTVTLRSFLPKRVPIRDVFIRQVARRFALTKDDFEITVVDTETDDSIEVPDFQVEVNEPTRVDVSAHPVPHDGKFLPVSGWIAFGKRAFKDEEEAGVRIYARGKIVATTRDFEQPAGFTGEFTARSYLVGKVVAEWLDEDGGEDLIRTDRQGILWDSEYGEALRVWGAGLIKQIAKSSAGPRRESKVKVFLANSDLEKRAKEKYGENKAVTDAVMDFGKKIGGLAHEDELEDKEYVDSLVDIVLLVGPHQALIKSFQAIAKLEDKSIEQLIPLFSHTRTAELASYAQIAQERVSTIKELEDVIDTPGVVEGDLQKLIQRAPWLIRPDWSVITQNQSLKTFRNRFAKYWEQQTGGSLEIAIMFESKQPDFTLVHIGQMLHIVEIKKPKHAFANKDYERLQNYLEAFEAFFDGHEQLISEFPDGWVVDLVVDEVNITDTTSARAFRSAVKERQVKQVTWNDFIGNAVRAHEEFLQAYDEAQQEHQDEDDANE
jgi:hypothetical protein